MSILLSLTHRNVGGPGYVFTIEHYVKSGTQLAEDVSTLRV